MIVANTIKNLVGNTPILRLNRLFKNSSCSIFAKLEMQNPTSLKDRAVLGMVKLFRAQKSLRPRVATLV